MDQQEVHQAETLLLGCCHEIEGRYPGVKYIDICIYVSFYLDSSHTNFDGLHSNDTHRSSSLRRKSAIFPSSNVPPSRNRTGTPRGASEFSNRLIDRLRLTQSELLIRRSRHENCKVASSIWFLSESPERMSNGFLDRGDGALLTPHLADTTAQEERRRRTNERRWTRVPNDSTAGEEVPDVDP